MKNRKDHNKYFAILELSSDASLAEIRKAYLFLKELYSTESIATIPAEDEISEKRKQEILQQIEEAYHRLLALFRQESREAEQARKPLLPDDDSQKAASEISTYSGQTLQQIREKLNIDLFDIALTTKIQARHLENIEKENYDDLPPEVYVKGFIISYAQCLSLDPKMVANDYMNRYHIWKDTVTRK